MTEDTVGDLIQRAMDSYPSPVTVHGMSVLFLGECVVDPKTGEWGAPEGGVWGTDTPSE